MTLVIVHGIGRDFAKGMNVLEEQEQLLYDGIFPLGRGENMTKSISRFIISSFFSSPLSLSYSAVSLDIYIPASRRYR